MTTACPDCDLAGRVVHHGYNANCRRCKARMVARSPEFFATRQQCIFSANYVALLNATGLHHEEAREESERDYLMANRVGQ
jgi:uncharacterized paraquat-inducible protein A